MKEKGNKQQDTILITLALAAVLLLMPIAMTAPQQQQTQTAYALDKDFCLTAENPDGTIFDCADKPKFCKSLEDFYESEGYVIIEKCKAVFTGE